MKIKVLCAWCGKDAGQDITDKTTALTIPNGWYMALKSHQRMMTVHYFCSIDCHDEWKRHDTPFRALWEQLL